MENVTNESTAAPAKGTGQGSSNGKITRAHGASAAAVPPHGGELVDRLVTGKAAADLAARAARLPRVELNARTAADAELIATGAFSPLRGFVGSEDYRSIIAKMRLASGAVFSIPITLTVPRELAATARSAGAVALALPASEGGVEGGLVGVLEVEEVYDLDVEAEALGVYRTTDPKHPGVAYLLERRGEVALGGPLTLFRRTLARRFPDHHRDPAEVRALIAARGWKRTVAFQTRNPIHRAHEYLLRSALETVDGLVVHPLVGETKGDDVAADVRMACYEALLGQYFPESRVLLTVFPFAMRYAGPREAVLHAIARQNYGFSHFIIGRDHAGVGNYYGTYDAQRIFDELGEGDLAIVPLFFEHSFHCRACGGVASLKTCPHDEGERLVLSGTRVRELLSSGTAPPVEYSRPEVAQILVEAYRAQRGATA